MRPLPRAALAAFIAIAASSAVRAESLDVTRNNVMTFMSEMHREHGFDPTALATLLRDAQTQPRIVEAMERPAERSMAWWEYRARFMTDERIDGGVRIWREHRETLEKVSRDSGVPPQYLIAITGVETLYGRITGNYRILDALATLAFDYPRRATYFRGELLQFLLLAREEGIDARTLKGSYAGASGIAQFMPSSYRRFAVDGNGDGKRDLWSWGPDVFASIAHYFQENGWRAGEPVLSDASHDAPPDDPAKSELALKETVSGLRARGYRFDTTLPAESKAMLIPAALQQGTAWRVGYQNFYVITRYNRSLLYAMAVNDLADAIAARYQAAAAAPPATPVTRQP
ncbi:MAG: lytic murein transglycosylase B [Steroidobacteraceae bacterium]